MVFHCSKHDEMSIDDVCPECDFQGKAPKLHRMRTDKRYFKRGVPYLIHDREKGWLIAWYTVDHHLISDNGRIKWSLGWPDQIYEIQI